MSKASFGAPPALPGQNGYGTRESDRLEAEAAEMAQRLQALRTQMSREKEKREATQKSKVGGARWRSARTDRSVHNYAKEVKERNNQRVAAARRGDGMVHGAAPKAAAAARRSNGTARENEAVDTSHVRPPVPNFAEGASAVQSSYQGKPNVATWAVGDTLSWLDAIGLGQYAEVFEKNEISGGILLEVGLQDLDYMEIRVLGHRKTLLKGIEELKRGQLPAPPPMQAVRAQQRPAPSTSSSTNTESNAGAERAQPKTLAPRVHWSQVAPISDNKVDGSAVPVNLADGDYDEAAAQREFQEAVMAWRNGTSNPVSEEPEAAKDDGMWHNPWGGSDNQTSSEAGTGEGTGGSLLEGTLDEDREHEEFAKAVAAWRSGGTTTVESSKQQDGQVSSDTGSEAAMAVVSSSKVAEELAKKLDEGFKSDANELTTRRLEAEEILRQQQEELAKSRQLLAQQAAAAETTVEELDDDEEEKLSLNFGGTFIGGAPWASPPLSPANSEPPDSPHDTHMTSDVDVALVESTMGFTPRGDKEADYSEEPVVEEPSDEEDM